MTRAASLLLRVVGLALVLVAAMGFTLVGDGGSWTAHATVPAGRTAVLVEPAVASVLGPSVSIEVTPEGQDTTPYFLGLGRSDDLAAYVRDQDVVRVVGFDGSRRLALQHSAASAPGSTDGSRTPWPAPATVDLWQQQVSGPGARQLFWRPTAGARSILVAHGDGSPLPALDVTVTWTDGRWLWYPVGALVLGLVMIVGGFALAGALPLVGVRARAARARPAGAGRAPADVPRRTDVPDVPDVPAEPADHREPPDPPAPPEPPGPPEPPDPPGPAGEVPLTRSAARGRRRKETAWQRARAKATSRTGGRR